MRPDATPGGNETVLIVDDNEDVRDMSAVIVGSLGYEVLLMSGYPAGTLEKCNFPILHKPYRREQWALRTRAAQGGPVVVDV